MSHAWSRLLVDPADCTTLASQLSEGLGALGQYPQTHTWQSRALDRSCWGGRFPLAACLMKNIKLSQHWANE